jgi:hypothetical protein
MRPPLFSSTSSEVIKKVAAFSFWIAAGRRLDIGETSLRRSSKA